MGAPSVGDIVLVNFPFSDLSDSKKRPALVLAEASHDDFILCQITSKPYADPRAIEISDEDFQAGTLNLTSFVRPDKLFTANSSLILRTLATVNRQTATMIVDSITTALYDAIEQLQEP